MSNFVQEQARSWMKSRFLRLPVRRVPLKLQTTVRSVRLPVGIAALALAVVYSSGPRAATDTLPSPTLIDQQQTVISSSLGTVPSGVFLAQSFIPSRSEFLAAAFWATDRNNQTAKFEIGIYASLEKGAEPLATPLDAKGKVNGWLGVTWDDPVELKPGRTYFLVVSDVQGGAFQFAGGSLLKPGDLYPQGQAFTGRIDDKTGEIQQASEFDNSARTFDLAFQTYAAPIPEPSTVLLMLAGVGCLALLLRRTRKPSA
jgi:hypothetical protein